jgi:hypothetical protein
VPALVVCLTDAAATGALAGGLDFWVLAERPCLPVVGAIR